MRLPFMVVVEFTRAQFCAHDLARQCDACFVEAMHGYEWIVGPVDEFVADYMRDHRLPNVSRVQTMSVLISPDQPRSLAHTR